MDWREEELEAGGSAPGADKAFCILHEAPAVPTARQAKGGGKAAGPTADELAQQKLLAHHPALYPGEPKEFRLRRAGAHQACWEALTARMQETLEGADRPVFQQLLSFARSHHRAPAAAARLGARGYRRLPTALVLAGGVNSADYTRTFPNLAQYLRDEGLYVALLDPQRFGRAVGEALNEVLRQFSGLDTKAEHAEALAAWYSDEVGDAAALPKPAVASSKESEPQQAQQQDGDEPGGRQLRQRAAVAGGAGGGSGGGGASERQRANWDRPLVVIVEGTESLDAGCLRDVVATLSELYAQLPVTLVLGLTTAEAALHDMLTSEVTDRCMDCHSFRLSSAMARLNRLVECVLLGAGGGWPGLLFEAGIVESLLQGRFFTHYYSTGIFRQGLQLAAIDHFATQPTSFLAAAALEGEGALRELCAQLPSAVSEQVRKAAAGRGGAKLAEPLLEAINQWRRWSVALQWLVAAAKFVGLSKGDTGRQWQPYSVYQDGLEPSFASSETGSRLTDLARHLRRLQPQEVCQLAGELQAVAEGVEGASAALKEELQQLQEVTRDAEQPQQAQQQDEAPAAAAAAPVEAAGPSDTTAPAAAAAAPAGAQAQPRSKRDRFHSKEARRAALMARPTQASAAAKGSAAAVAEQRAKEEAAPGARLAAWLLAAVGDATATPPTKLSGAAPVTCRGAGALRALSAVPRQAVHTALTEPHLWLEGLRGQVGVDASSEDASLAYSLFDQDPNCANVADWFQAFCDVHAVAQREQQAALPGTSKGKKAATKKKRSAAEQEEGGGPSGEARRQQQRELAARFSQATAELQLVGLIKPARRRRGDYVQRLVHMPAEED